MIAIIDKGIDLSHPDLRVVSGYNFVQPEQAPQDVDSHGTACAGVAGAIANNRIGPAGIAGGVQSDAS